MDMNRAFFLKKEARKPQWHVIDADGLVLGRLATEVADRLRGKDKAFYTPHTDSGDYIVIINADKIVLTGNKWEDKIYQDYSGWIGNRKELTAKQLQEKRPGEIITLAVKRMLPKNTLSRYIRRKLRVYMGDKHPHFAQIAQEMEAEPVE